ncbi:MAG: mannitol-phosphate/altronate dehydrogenase [Eubacterium sp.]|nr:mannitol-phosphate/altronate dehydrogenase [Eubacterium sp.]
MKLNRNSLKQEDFWRRAGFEIPGFDLQQMLNNTYKSPIWIHFGAGNIFRSLIAALQQKLLEQGKTDRGIIAVAPNDSVIIDRIYKPSDNLTILIHLLPDGSLENKIIASVSESLVCNTDQSADWQRLVEVFCKPSLQMASFTVTEKGYGLTDISGELLDNVKEDIQNGPEKPQTLMAKIASLLYCRYKAGEQPIAMVSMDNCSHNGDILKSSVKTLAARWVQNGFADKGYLYYIDNPEKVTFPCTMVDKITPRPSESVEKMLKELNIEDTKISCTAKNSHIALFVNAERPQYLVIEDKFPNGRPPLEEAGVLFTDKETVDKVEKMKVTTCLNPLHTALAVFGCLLGYKLIADEMEDEQLEKLVEKIGYSEGMPVVVNPGIIDPKEFIEEVLKQRLPNPFIPDTPQRIACDTSQKIPVRFGETIKTYYNHPTLDVKSLTYIPLVIAGWCRYLMGVDDQGNEMALSPDPMLDELKNFVINVKLGNPDSVGDSLKPLLSNERIFGMNLYHAGLGSKIEGFFKEMIADRNAVREVLKLYV